MDYSLEFDNEKMPPNKKLSELPLKEKPIVTLCIRHYVEDQEGRSDLETIYLVTPDMIRYITLSKGERRQIAITRHQEEAAKLFKQAVEKLREE